MECQSKLVHVIETFAQINVSKHDIQSMAPLTIVVSSWHYIDLKAAIRHVIRLIGGVINVVPLPARAWS